MREIILGDTIDFKFCTVSTAGLPTTLVGSPVVSAYLGNNTTELTAGITLSVDFDGRTGLHNVRVVASSGNGYAVNTEYTLVVTAGTVGGTSIVGYVVGEFVIERAGGVLAMLKDIIGGSGSGTRTMSLKQLSIVNSSGDALVAQATGSNGRGIYATGNGTGPGFLIQGGATDAEGFLAVGGGSGSGLAGQGGVSGGAGIWGGAQAADAGIVGEGVGVGNGIEGKGGVEGAGAWFAGGTPDDPENGEGYGVIMQGRGAFAGLQLEGGATGPGLYSVGGATSGAGIKAVAQNDGDGILAAGSDGTSADTTMPAAGIVAIAGIGTTPGMLVLSGIEGDINGSGVVKGTVTTGASTTSVPTSVLSPAVAVADQFKYGILIFDKTTTTANLRGQRREVTGVTSPGGVITVAPALTDAPVSGDQFRIY